MDDRIAHIESGSTAPPLSAHTYYHMNHQGSVIAMTDYAGNVTGGAAAGQQLAYDEYGNLSSASNSTGEQFRFTGRRYDAETGLYYYRARYYSPQLGRFLQVDPVGYKDDIDLYTYVGNDPLNGTDPDGREIRLQSHPVAFGKNHSKITIVPKDQSKYKNDPRFKNTLADGRVYATIGAGPSGSIPGFLGNLVEGVNRTRDVDQSSNKTDEVLQLPDGMSEDQAIDALFADSGAYPNDLTYALFPKSEDKDYNSNGFANGLLHAVGFKGYKQPPSTPGFNLPVPDSKLTPKGTVTVGEPCPEAGCSK